MASSEVGLFTTLSFYASAMLLLALFSLAPTTHALHFATCSAQGAFGIHTVPARHLEADVSKYSNGKLTLTEDPLHNASAGEHSLITMMVYMECDLFMLGKHTWSELVFQVPHVKRADCKKQGHGCTTFLAQPSCYTTCDLAVVGDTVLAWSSKNAQITPINSNIWQKGKVKFDKAASEGVASSFEPVGPWMNATAPEAVAHPAWQALMDATSKLSMIGTQKALFNRVLECSSMVYDWKTARVRPIAGSININQDAGMPNTLPAGTKVKYDGNDGSSMQIESEFVISFPKFCPP